MDTLRLINYFNRIRFEGPNDKGSGGSAPIDPPAAPSTTSKKWFNPVDSSGAPLMDGRLDGEPAPADPAQAPAPAPEPDTSKSSGETEGERMRNRIKESSKKIDESTDKKQRTLPYFEDDEGDEGDPDAPAKPKASDDPPADPNDPPADPTDEKYYDPEVHAKDKPVYPNAFNSRRDAEMGIAAKIDLYEKQGGQLEELESEVGSTIPYAVQQKIKKFSDVTTLADASDDEIREFIVDLDMSLKSNDEKIKVRKQAFTQNKALEKADQEFKEVHGRASEASKALKLPTLIAKVGQDATIDDVIGEVDNFITDQLKPLQEKIRNHEANEKYAQEHGQVKFVETLRNLESELAQKKQSLTEHKQAIVDWNDKKAALEQVKSSQAKQKELTPDQKLQIGKDTYFKWKEDRKVGNYIPNIFKDPTADSESHFVKFAFAESNRNKYDLTTKAGWDQMNDYYDGVMAKRYEESKSEEVIDKASKRRTSSATTPVPQPNPNDPPGPPVRSTYNAMEESRRRIREHAKNL